MANKRSCREKRGGGKSIWINESTSSVQKNEKEKRKKKKRKERKEDFRGIILSIRLCSIITQPSSRDEAEGQQGEVERNSATLRSAIERLDRARDTKDLVEDPV